MSRGPHRRFQQRHEPVGESHQTRTIRILSGLWFSARSDARRATTHRASARREFARAADTLEGNASPDGVARAVLRARRDHHGARREPIDSDGLRSEHRGARPDPSHDGFAEAREPRRDARRRLRHHGRGHSPQRRHDDPGCAASRAERGSRSQQFAPMDDLDPRVQQRPVQQAAGSDRRPQRVFAALRGRVLGRPGRFAGRRRAHRSRGRARRYRLGRERRQRRDQHHHALGSGSSGSLRRGRCGQRGASLRGVALWLEGRRQALDDRVRQELRARLDEDRDDRRGRRRRLAPFARRLRAHVATG